MTCIFCDIIQGAVQGSIVYRNSQIIAILDVRQANPGHVLVIPKEHVENIYALSDETGAYLMAGITRISRAVQRVFAPEGLSIWQSNGKGAHQEVPHVHFHIHPRWQDDDLLRVYPVKPNYPTRSQLDEYAQKLQGALAASD